MQTSFKHTTQWDDISIPKHFKLVVINCLGKLINDSSSQMLERSQELKQNYGSREHLLSYIITTFIVNRTVITFLSLSFYQKTI